MTDLEKRAIVAISDVRMYPGTGSKRFRRQLVFWLGAEPQRKLSEAQARFLWSISYRLRRQIKDVLINRQAVDVKMTGALPPGDYAPKLMLATAPKYKGETRPKTRLQIEIERGGGRLEL